MAAKRTPSPPMISQGEGLEGLDDSEQFPTNNADEDSKAEIAEVIKGVGRFADFLDFRDADFEDVPIDTFADRSKLIGKLFVRLS